MIASTNALAGKPVRRQILACQKMRFEGQHESKGEISLEHRFLARAILPLLNNIIGKPRFA